MAHGGARARGRWCYGTGARKTKEGKRSGAHSKVVGDPNMLGDGLVTTNRSTGAVGAEDEDGVDEEAPGRPASCGSTGRTKPSFRSSGLCQRGEAVDVAVVNGVGADGCARPCA